MKDDKIKRTDVSGEMFNYLGHFRQPKFMNEGHNNFQEDRGLFSETQSPLASQPILEKKSPFAAQDQEMKQNQQDLRMFLEDQKKVEKFAQSPVRGSAAVGKI